MEELPINIADAGLLLVLVISAIFGFARGFVKEVLSISGWVGATFLSLYLFPILKPYARDYINNLLIADILTGSLIFILSLVILSYITHAISERVKASDDSRKDVSELRSNLRRVLEQLHELVKDDECPDCVYTQGVCNSI